MVVSNILSDGHLAKILFTISQIACSNQLAWGIYKCPRVICWGRLIVVADKGLSDNEFTMHFTKVRLILLTMYLDLALLRMRF